MQRDYDVRERQMGTYNRRADANDAPYYQILFKKPKGEDLLWRRRMEGRSTSATQISRTLAGDASDISTRSTPGVPRMSIKIQLLSINSEDCGI
jgi:hypothetical protein